MKRFEDRWEDGQGTTFFGQGWEPEDTPARAVIVLVHGLGEHTGRYDHVGRVLTDAGYILASFDLRGHGRSGGARGHSPSLDVYMQDIGRFFRRMEERYPGLPQFLYGHSLGGLLVLAYAIRHGEGLKGVIATAPGLRSSLREQKAKIALVQLLGSVAPTLTVESGLEAAAISRDPEVVAAFRNDPLVHFSASLGFGKAALRAIDICYARGGEFPAPLLLMHGEADRIAYVSGSQEFADLMRRSGRDVTIKRWPEMYHELHNDPEKERFFAYLIQWLDGYA